MFVNDVHAMGLKTGQGLLLTEAFYWDMNDETRAFAKKFAARMGGKMPSANQAGVYSSTLAYLRAVAATGSDNALIQIDLINISPLDRAYQVLKTDKPDQRCDPRPCLDAVVAGGATAHESDHN